MPSLTRLEAVARAAVLHIDRYEIDLDLTSAPAGGTFDSTTIVRFSCSDPGTTTFVEVAAESVVDVWLNGTVLDPKAVVDDRLELVDLRADNELRIRAAMRYSQAVEGIHRFVDPADNEVYLYAQSGLDYAKNIFACFDQPDLKARISLRVIAPVEWVVRANGAGTQVSAGRWEFVDTAPISTYLMTVVAGPYVGIADKHDGIELGLYARRSLGPLLDAHAEEIVRITRSCFDHYHELFGIRYPFGKYDQVFVPEFNWGAVENPGCVTFREELLFRSAVTETDRQRRAVIIAHEMAHMWFGDLVTMAWWDDIWLNESFAEYMGWRVTAAVTEYTDAWTAFAVERKVGGLVADQRPSTHPVAPTDVVDVDRASLNFDGISYAKGASTLRQLVAWIGDEAFLSGLRNYFVTHAYGNATLADLLAALSSASGRDLEDWAQVWLRRPQVNTLQPEVVLDAAGRYRDLAVLQTAPAAYPTLRPHRIGVASYGSTAVRRVEVDLAPTVDNGRTTVAGLIGTEPGRLLLLNDGDLSFVKVRFDEASRAGLMEVVPGLTDSLARAVVWGALADSVRDAEMPAGEYLRLAATALPLECKATIFEEVVRFGREFAARRYTAPAGRAAALAQLAHACLTVLDRVSDSSEPTPDTLVAAARGFVGCAGPAEAARLTDWLAGLDVPTGLAIDTDLRWAICYRLVVLGVAGEAEIVALGRSDPSAQGVETGARCRAAIADPSAKARAWAMTEDGSVSSRILTATTEGFWHVEQSELTAGYVEQYFDEMPLLSQRRSANIVRPAAMNLFPRYAVSVETVAAADAMLTRDDLDPGLRRVVVDATDELRRALAARNL
jgi:aminopeptidase N